MSRRELVPRLGHRPGERRGDRRQKRSRRVPRRTPADAPVDAANHRLWRPADQGPGSLGLAGIAQGNAAKLDRRSTGAEVDFELAIDRLPGEEEAPTVTVFTTRPDTLYGATYMVLAPEHPLVDRISTPAQTAAVAAYRQQCATKSDRDRMADAKEKTGVFTGGYAINPMTEQQIPVYIADYVMMGYGTGAIMAVPAHDQRDYDFATKFGIPIRQVVKPSAGEGESELPAGKAFEEEGVAINSPIINGQTTAAAKETMIRALESESIGMGSTKYKLRDWLFSTPALLG